MDSSFENDAVSFQEEDDDNDDDDDDDGKAVVTIKEYVDGLEAQELEVDMILGGDDGKECTYSKGYLPRQAVFSCITCCPEGNAGVCTACSMACHDGHEVIEIWTRRHFRCDCGNSKFGIGICKLFGSKDIENCENVYNQNFTGVYCTCKRPYPDPDCEEDMGEMLQCCVCEDWFHEVHLGLASTEEVPRDDEGEPLYEELICPSCTTSLDFLSYYDDLLVSIPDSSKHKEGEFTENNCTNMRNVYNDLVAIDDATQIPLVNPSKESLSLDLNTNSTMVVESDKKMDPEQPNFHESATVNCDQRQYGCKLKSRENLKLANRRDTMIIFEETDSRNKVNLHNRASFLKKDWRSELCRCETCYAMYSTKGVSFLLDPEDTIAKYEEKAKQKRKEKMEDLSFLNNQSRVGQIEFLHGLNDMTTQLSSFFASHKSGEAITSDDIYEFFDKLKRKRARLTE